MLRLITPGHFSHGSRTACRKDFDLSAGEITATEALRDAGQSLKEVCQHVRSTFKAANDSFDQTQSMQT